MATIEKTTKDTMALEKRLTALVNDARKRRAYVHALAMAQLTPKQYARAIPILTQHGYGVNVFPVHHVHPPLSMAVIGAYVDAVAALLALGADPHMTYPTSNGGRTSPIQLLCELLIKHSRTPRSMVKYRQMLLTFLSYKGDLDKKVHPSSPLTFHQMLVDAGIVL